MKTLISALALAATLAAPGMAIAQNAALTANYGEVRLSAGFTPDPHRVNLTAGGRRLRAPAGRLGCRSDRAERLPDHRTS